MYLVERTIKLSYELISGGTDVMSLIRGAYAHGLQSYGVTAIPSTSQQREALKVEMKERQELLFSSTHNFVKNGEMIIREVSLYRDEVSYKKFATKAIGIPEFVNEAELDLDIDHVTILVTCETINQ